jgi:hypothetical protein
MAHFAELDSSNTVLRVVVIANSDCLDASGAESEQVGVAFCQTLFGAGTYWRQTSYNNKFRKRYAGIGYTYDETLDAFITPKPYPSWVFNSETYDWEAPVPYPSDGNLYSWDEATLSWVPVAI